MHGRSSRRELLRVGAVVGAASLGGCLDRFPLVGESDGVGQWSYEHGTVGDGEGYGLGVGRPAKIDVDDDGVRSYVGYHSGGNLFDQISGLDWQRAPLAARVQESFVLELDHDRRAVASELEDGDGETTFEQDGTHRGYDVYLGTDSREEPTVAFATNGSVAVIGRDMETGAGPRATLEAAIDAEAGAVTRQVEADDVTRRVVDRIRGTDVGWVNRFVGGISGDTELAGVYGHGMDLQIEPETSQMRLVYVYDDPGEVDADAHRKHAKEGDDGLYDLDDPTVRTDGTTVVVEATVETKDVQLFG